MFGFLLINLKGISTLSIRKIFIYESYLKKSNVLTLETHVNNGNYYNKKIHLTPTIAKITSLVYYKSLGNNLNYTFNNERYVYQNIYQIQNLF